MEIYNINMKLIVIGNGFDLSHGMKTKYSDFMNFLNDRDRKKLEYTFDLDDEEHWNYLEDKIADSYEYIHNEINEIASNIVIDEDSDEEPWKEADTMAYALEDEVRWVFMDGNIIKERIFEWVNSITIPIRNDLLIDFFKDSVVIDFNYTKLSEELYGAENVIYIHGNKDNKDSIQLGSITKVREEKNSEYFSDYGNGINYNRIFDQYQKKTHENIIRLNESIDWSKIEEIYVVGHSMGRQDKEYFDEIERKTSLELKVIDTEENNFIDGLKDSII